MWWNSDTFVSSPKHGRRCVCWNVMRWQNICEELVLSSQAVCLAHMDDNYWVDQWFPQVMCFNERIDMNFTPNIIINQIHTCKRNPGILFSKLFLTRWNDWVILNLYKRSCKKLWKLYIIIHVQLCTKSILCLFFFKCY